ncbi:ATP-binding protein [Qipengyuania sp. ASV99]|uniref:ATP-binding protein n=1 Tax=Qipengyuania sp. ASV99 TaxID=3399681 RepID=UPI003A4C65EE
MVESATKPHAATQRSGAGAMIACGPIDRRSLLAALFGSIAYLVLSAVSLLLSQVEVVLASVWVPNAGVVAMLLIARLRCEWPIYAGIMAASMAAHFVSGNGAAAALMPSAANLAEIALVTWLIRRSCDGAPDMNDLSHLGRFLAFGGLAGPLVSAIIAAAAIGFGGAGAGAALVGASSWFLAHSMGMILFVPAALMLAHTRRSGSRPSRAELADRGMIILSGLLAMVLVFNQDRYPLEFIVPPMTLIVAIRLGGLGTALYVPCVAITASAMTYAGLGPFALHPVSAVGKMFVIQAFIAANFLTGLPIAAILAGRARLSNELAAGRSELALLADNVTDAVFSVDHHGACSYASPSVQEVLGIAPSDLIGQQFCGLGRDGADERIAAVFHRLLSGEADKERISYRRLLDARDGTPVYIEADCAVVLAPETGEPTGIAVCARDVTERVELELLLTRARRSAENAARVKSEFLANMSHEIRTPMNGVLGFAEMMLQDDLDDAHRRHTEMIVQSGRAMMLLLNDILDLSKIEAGQISVDHAPVDLYSTIRECAALHRPAAAKKGLDLVLAPAPASEAPLVVSDALRIRQIILNLIGNAVKFTQQGRVEIACHITAGEVWVEVSDTGIGVRSDRIEAIFAPFTQGENDTARRFGGTGLGLTISRQLAELLGGRIKVDSEKGTGSRFRLTLPANLAEPAPPSAKQETPAIPAESFEPPQRARILLVEDHEVNRLLGTEMLERCGQSVAAAHDGNEAIAMVIDSMMRGQCYDLVLMDIQMPGCDGITATRTLRGEGIGADVLPIVALSANAYPEDIAAARKAGMQAHLAKPLVFADLARALQRWLPTRIVEAGHDRTGPDNAAAPIALPHSGGLAPQAAQRGGWPMPQHHSPALIHRWNKRRFDAVEAVRCALETGALGNCAAAPESSEALARLVHKLAGTAAIFGEPELGDQAAALERALRRNLPADVQLNLAMQLLSMADDPVDSLGAAAG